MKVVRGAYDRVPVLEGAWAVTLGTFDGVHLGHQAVLRELRRVGDRSDFAGACAVTFGRHPRTLLDPASAPSRLSSDAERESLLEACGVDVLVVLDFDERLAALSYDQFVRDVLRARLGLRHFVLGHDVHFGRGRGGNVVTVTRLAAGEGFAVDQVPSVFHGGEAVSSTRIRGAIDGGHLALAIAMLGHPYPLCGRVVAGRRLGRSLGFPTANVVPEHPRKVLPPRGVYAGWARPEGGAWREAVVNIGIAPTVGEGGPSRVETHLLDCSLELYGRRLEVALAHGLRPEMRFEGLEALRAAIEADARRARAWLAEAPAEARPGRLEDLR